MNAASSTIPAPVLRPPILGCIADDVTGATDLALNLVQGGLRVVQVLGLPSAATLAHTDDVDALVVALRSRSTPAADAVAESLTALRLMQARGIGRFYFKYCSTFDSTPAGNIGPVAEALMAELGTPATVFCPAFPRAGRSVYRGHLFVGDRLLNESGMQDHPLNPMTDPDLVRVLAAQSTLGVGLIDHAALRAGPNAVIDALADHAANGRPLVVTDAGDDADLALLARALADRPLVTGGSGLARFLPEAYRAAGALGPVVHTPQVPTTPGRALLIAGSCSRATQGQVARARTLYPAWTVDVPAVLNDGDTQLAELEAWAASHDPARPLLVASTAAPEQVSALQAQHGVETVAHAVEAFLGNAARRLVERQNVRRLVVAGGETSGAVAAALGVKALRIGPEICPGVPWTESLGGDAPLALAFKSGNFGDEDFLITALEMLP